MPLIAASDNFWFDSAEVTGLKWKHTEDLIKVKTRDAITDEEGEIQMWEDAYNIIIARGALTEVRLRYTCYEMMMRALKKIEEAVKPIKV
jgi:hypothetical protein